MYVGMAGDAGATVRQALLEDGKPMLTVDSPDPAVLALRSLAREPELQDVGRLLVGG